MEWRDWLAIFSTIIGTVGFVITIITLIRTGNIQKAVEAKEKETKSIDMFSVISDELLSKIEPVKYNEVTLDDFFIIISIANKLLQCKEALTNEEIVTLKEIKSNFNSIYLSGVVSEKSKRTFILYSDQIKQILTKGKLK